MRKLLFLFGLILFLSSCGWINPSIMLKTGKDYQYAKSPDSTKALDYKISPNDILESDGSAKLPVLGRIKLIGYTIREAESLLEEKYASFYVRPYVIMSVSNKRVIVFPGSAGDAKVIPLQNNNTTLIEALALAGGIADDGKARMVKLIRQNNDKHDVFLIDLSKIEGIKQGSMVLQANDIIYVEPRKKYASRFVQEAAPIISILTSAFVLFTYSKAISK
jgi:polysaccharide export outer membrane protein